MSAVGQKSLMLDSARNRHTVVITALLLAACKPPATPPVAPPPAAPKTTAAPGSTAAISREHAAPSYVAVPSPPVVSVYMRPLLTQPPPIAVGWAPPPLLVDSPPHQPSPSSVWIGGYWTWEGSWIWAHGHWLAPPRKNYSWVQPYYEHRDGAVFFIDGHWAAPGVAFVPPPPGLHLPIESAGPAVIAGARPIGPEGVFVPPPPGSHPGITLPAPIGTAPAVVTSAPPVVAVGMRVSVDSTSPGVNPTKRTSQRTDATSMPNVPDISTVIIVAPAGVTVTGKPVNIVVPAEAHRAAALAPVVQAAAPAPTSPRSLSTFVHGHPLPALPPAQAVMTEAAAVHRRPARVPMQPGSQLGRRLNGAAPQAKTLRPALAPSKKPPAAGATTPTQQ